MATRPGYIWSGTEWVAIGQEAVLNPFYYQATAPSSPATGAIWVESDVDVPSVDSSQFLRWRKTMAGGETSLSGTDDSSLTLQYTAGYEKVFLNGVLLVRGVDYTATTGTTVTGLTALVASDVVEVFSVLARAIADVYTQTQSDAKYGIIGTSAPFRIAAGSLSMPTSTETITFPSGRFTATPIITIGMATGTLGRGVTITASSSTSFTVTGFVTSTGGATTTAFNWTAVQMTSGSGAG
jgi:hypothetical protein